MNQAKTLIFSVFLCVLDPNQDKEINTQVNQPKHFAHEPHHRLIQD